MHYELVNEPAGIVAAREALLDRVFGPGRLAKTSQRLRDGQVPAPGLSFAAFSESLLLGTLRFWEIGIGPSRRPALLLGPLAVLPEIQGAGVGKALVRHGLAKARDLGHEAVLLVGDAPYYAHFGFDAALAQGLELPGPVERARFQGLELVPGALAGVTGMLQPSQAPLARKRLVRQARGGERRGLAA